MGPNSHAPAPEVPMSHRQTVHTARRTTAPRLTYAAGAVAGTILMFSSPAAAASPRPEDTSGTPVVVERVEVPVPVDDTVAEVVQMQLAAAVAAILAAATTKARLRRRYQHPTGSAVIDITDPRVLDRQTDEATRAKEAI
jgi:hypothetical protein